MTNVKTNIKATQQVFATKLQAYKTAIDADIAAYTKEIRKSTLNNFGAHSRLATDAYCEVLERGGKRIRGALTMLGYEMTGGKNHTMILKAARAIEMVHAYILIIDDINDRSPTRRGGPTAHYQLAAYYRKRGLGDDAEHFGESIAMNAALLGNHAAQTVMANLEVDQQLALNAVSILNRSMVITAHGQFNDIFNESTVDVREADVDRMYEWKTAHYSFLNPLHVGMVLAGADCHATDGITEYAMQAGKAYQITDDILGTFGEEFESGKSPLDDIKEGKRTILTVYALEHGSKTDKNFLIQMLGNHNLTPVEFQRCKDILVDSGALTHAQELAQSHVEQAIAALQAGKSHWSGEGTQFLTGLAQYLLGRSAWDQGS